MSKTFEFVQGDTIDIGDGLTLKRICAIVDIPDQNVKVGDFGGYIMHEHNLQDNAWVSGNARVSGYACVSGNAIIAETQDYLQIGPAKSSGRYTTAYKDDKVVVRVNCGCFSGSIKEFSEAIEKTHKDNKEFLEQYRLFCQLIAFTFGVTE